MSFVQAMHLTMVLWFGKKIDTEIYLWSETKTFFLSCALWKDKGWLFLSTKIMDSYDYFHCFLPPSSIFKILPNNHKLLLQSEKVLIIVTRKLGVYQFNTAYLTYVSLLTLSIWHPVVLLSQWLKFAEVIYKPWPSDLYCDHTGSHLSLSKMMRQISSSTLTSNILNVITKVTTQAFYQNYTEPQKKVREADC